MAFVLIIEIGLQAMGRLTGACPEQVDGVLEHLVRVRQ